MQFKFFNYANQVTMEMHKVRVVQKLHLLPVEERLAKIKEAGNNTFLLQNRDVFMDMLTDSGVNAMSDNQVAAMGIADDSYAGSETCNRLIDANEEVFGVRHFLPAHQGRACENILAETFVRPGQFVLMNFHFTTTKAHITRMGGSVIELVGAEGLVTDSQPPFKGTFDIERTNQIIKDLGAKDIAFVRIEAGTNLIGGQPVSLENMLEVAKICKENGIMSILDASLLQDNLYFMKTREEMCKNMSIKDIMHKLASEMDIVFFSARKLGFARGGAIISHNEDYILRMKEYIPLYEGFLTYGGMEVRSMEAMAVGLRETLDMEYISQGPLFIEYMIKELDKAGVPVVKPAGGLGAHINAREILPHIPQSQYPAAALATALYIAGGVRGMERGTLSEQRNPDGTERFADMELVRLAVPRRVFTLSQLKYCIDRVKWVYDNRELIGGLRWEDEPRVLRFFFGRLQPIGDWQERLAEKFRADFGDSL